MYLATVHYQYIYRPCHHINTLLFSGSRSTIKTVSDRPKVSYYRWHHYAFPTLHVDHCYTPWYHISFRNSPLIKPPRSSSATGGLYARPFIINRIQSSSHHIKLRIDTRVISHIPACFLLYIKTILSSDISKFFFTSNVIRTIINEYSNESLHPSHIA